MEQQAEFLFAGGPAPELQPPDPRSGFHAEVAAAWKLPVGQAVRVALQDHDIADLRGRLELARAPDLPLDPRQPIDLRIGAIEFTSRQIAAWSFI